MRHAQSHTATLSHDKVARQNRVKKIAGVTSVLKYYIKHSSFMKGFLGYQRGMTSSFSSCLLFVVITNRVSILLLF